MSALTVNDVYRPVCTVMGEPGGMQLGITTEAAFVSYFTNALESFLCRTRLIQQVFIMQMLAGFRTYAKPRWVADIEHMWLNQRALGRSSEPEIEYMASRKEQGAPSQWRNDRLATDQYAVFPTPNLNGRIVVSSLGGGLGIVSSVSGALDFTIEVDTAPAYGVISDEYGALAIIVTEPLYGVISDILVAPSNLMAIGVAAPEDIELSVASMITVIPKAYWPFLKYGVLARIFSENSEHKDTLRANYCSQVFEEGIQLGAAIMDTMEGS